MGIWLRRLAYLLRRSRHEQELRDEIEAHRALRAEQLRRDGLPAREADERSRRALGNVLLARDDVRELWLGSWDTWWRDVRGALRSARANPAFTTAAVATLALGIGVNAGIFMVVNAVLFRGITAPRAGELVSVSQTVEGVPAFAGDERFSTADYVASRDRARTLALAAYANARGEATLGGDTPRRLLGLLVSCNYFAVLEQPPVLGRPLAEADCTPGAPPVVVLSHGLWRTVFASDPAIVGRTIQLNRQTVTVAGVAAENTFTGSPLLVGGYLAPLTVGRLLATDDVRYDEGVPWLSLLGRRSRGVSPEQVRAELEVIAAQIDRQEPGRTTRLTIARAEPSLGDVGRAAAGAAVVLMVAFGLILLMACANVANLMLARAASRSHEVALRLALGASRGRVVRQLLTESLVLALAGGALGSALAFWSFQSLVALALPSILPPWFPLAVTLDISPDLRVAAFAAVVSLGAALTFGLAPALATSRPGLHSVMKQGAPSATGGRHRSRVHASIVGIEVALCMVLMVAAGLLLRGLHAAYTIDPGFEYHDVALVSLESAFDGYSEEEARTGRQRLMAALEALPGVESVASAEQEPLGDDMAPTLFRLPGEGSGPTRVGEVVRVSERFFPALGIPIIRGRGFTADEVHAGGDAALRPAIVSATTARNLWPDGDPIGRTLTTQPPGGNLPPVTLQVVGVAADAQLNSLGQVDRYFAYVPGEGSTVLIKGRGGFSAVAPAIAPRSGRSIPRWS